MTEIVLRRIAETCGACPSQWDAWDTDGNYWYLRYRHGRGTAERQPGPDPGTWQDRTPEIAFTSGDQLSGFMSLDDFCRLAGLGIAPDAEIIPEPPPVRGNAPVPVLSGHLVIYEDAIAFRSGDGAGELVVRPVLPMARDHLAELLTPGEGGLLAAVLAGANPLTAMRAAGFTPGKLKDLMTRG